jgi:CBS domain-containing protein
MRPPIIESDATVEAASRLMRDERAGEVLVTNSGSPAGALSANDIVTRVVALGLDPRVVTAGDVLAIGKDQQRL